MERRAGQKRRVLHAAGTEPRAARPSRASMASTHLLTRPSTVAPLPLLIRLNFCYTLGMQSTAGHTDVAAAVRALAERHRVSYVPTDTDVLAHHITRLSGDDVRFDDVELLLIALQRAGHLSRREAVLWQADYLRQSL